MACAFSDADPAFLQELQEEEETAGTAAFENIGYALLEGAGEMSAEKPYLFLGGFSDEALKEPPGSSDCRTDAGE